VSSPLGLAPVRHRFFFSWAHYSSLSEQLFCSCMESSSIAIAIEQRRMPPLFVFASTVQMEATSLSNPSHSFLEAFVLSSLESEYFCEVIPFVVDMATSTYLYTYRICCPAFLSHLAGKTLVLLVLAEVPLRHVLFPWGGELDSDHTFQLVRPYHTIWALFGGHDVRREGCILSLAISLDTDIKL
jgi:hypothetical protein